MYTSLASVNNMWYVRIGPSHSNKRYVPYGQPYLVEDGKGSSLTDWIFEEFSKNIKKSKLQFFDSLGFWNVPDLFKEFVS